MDASQGVLLSSSLVGGAQGSATWPELLGSAHWDGLLDPLDPMLRRQILLCGDLCQVTYDSFNSDAHSRYCVQRRAVALLQVQRARPAARRGARAGGQVQGREPQHRVHRPHPRRVAGHALLVRHRGERRVQDRRRRHPRHGHRVREPADREPGVQEAVRRAAQPARAARQEQARPDPVSTRAASWATPTSATSSPWTPRSRRTSMTTTPTSGTTTTCRASGWNGKDGEFKLQVHRSVALVNKSSAFLKDENLVPESWWVERNKGMVIGETGLWQLEPPAEENLSVPPVVTGKVIDDNVASGPATKEAKIPPAVDDDKKKGPGTTFFSCFRGVK